MPNCTKCGSWIVHRSQQQDFYEYILGLATIYPFRCQLCCNRFLALFKRVSINPRREYIRVLVNYPVVMKFLNSEGQEICREGIVLNLSRQGCRIKGNMNFPIGAHLSLEIELQEFEPPLVIQTAVVRFAKGGDLGIEFLDLARQNEIRLRRLIEERLHAVPAYV